MRQLFSSETAASWTGEDAIEGLKRLGYWRKVERLKMCGRFYPCSDRLHCDACKAAYCKWGLSRIRGAIAVMRHPIELRFNVIVRDLGRGLKILTREFHKLRQRKVWKLLKVRGYAWVKHPGRRMPDGTWEPHLHVFVDVGCGFSNEGAICASWAASVAELIKSELEPDLVGEGSWEGSSPESADACAKYVARTDAFSPETDSDEAHEALMKGLKGARMFGVSMPESTSKPYEPTLNDACTDRGVTPRIPRAIRLRLPRVRGEPSSPYEVFRSALSGASRRSDRRSDSEALMNIAISGHRAYYTDDDATTAVICAVERWLAVRIVELDEDFAGVHIPPAERPEIDPLRSTPARPVVTLLVETTRANFSHHGRPPLAGECPSHADDLWRIVIGLRRRIPHLSPTDCLELLCILDLASEANDRTGADVAEVLRRGGLRSGNKRLVRSIQWRLKATRAQVIPALERLLGRPMVVLDVLDRRLLFVSEPQPLNRRPQ